MTSPVDYMGMLQGQDPGQALLQGLQIGGAINQQRQQQQQQQAAQQRAQQYKTDLAEAFKSPTADVFARLTMNYPEQREAAKQAWGQLSEARKMDEFGAASKAYAALNAGRPELAVSLYEQRVQAMKAAGADATEEQQVLDLMKADPASAKGYIGYAMFSADPEKFSESVAKLGGEQRAQAEAPADLAAKQAGAAKTAAEAKSAAITAQYADSQAVADLTKKGWDITKIQQDIGIAKESNRIRAMEAAASKEGNALKREELQLKIDDTKRARDEKIRENAATAETGANNIDNMLNTIQRIKSNPSLKDVVGSFEGRMPESASMLDDEESDAISLINTLGSQAFLAKIPEMKGTGQLSNAEGDKLQSALQNLGRAQSEKQFNASLDEAGRLLNKARENLSKKSGVPLRAPDTPAAPGAKRPLSAFDGSATLDPRSGVPALPGP